MSADPESAPSAAPAPAAQPGILGLHDDYTKDCRAMRAREACEFQQGDLCLDCFEPQDGGELCNKHEAL